MKKGIHPTYYPEATITCNCGNTFITGATVASLHVDICSACHPFYTGTQKLIDTEGRVERFEKHAARAATIQETVQEKRAKQEQLQKAQEEAPKTLREMFEIERAKLKKDALIKQALSARKN